MTSIVNPIPDSDLHELRRRLAATRWAVLPGGVGWDRGTDEGYLRQLVDRWVHAYDWRHHERRIRALPWISIGQQGRAIRAVHRPSSVSDAPVVVLLHGWPDSVLRFERLLPLLDDVHVIIPALPGFPFAYSIAEPGMTVAVMASMVADAVEQLGYRHYVVSGGDVGVDVAEHLATLYPDRVAALHLTNVSPLHAVFADRSVMGPEELRYLEEVAVWQRKEGGYIAEQSTKPHSLAPALADSPAGLAAWFIEKLRGWADVPLEDDDLLTWISAYWFTNTIGTSFAPYVEFAPPVPFVATPTVLSAFARDIKLAPRAFASHFVNVQTYIQHDSGGHFAAWEKPELYASDLRHALALMC